MISQFIVPKEITRKVFVLGFDPYLLLIFGSAVFETGSVQGYVQFIVWKISIQLSVKWVT